jgi:hypothetical protein
MQTHGGVVRSRQFRDDARSGRSVEDARRRCRCSCGQSPEIISRCVCYIIPKIPCIFPSSREFTLLALSAPRENGHRRHGRRRAPPHRMLPVRGGVGPLSRTPICAGALQAPPRAAGPLHRSLRGSAPPSKQLPLQSSAMPIAMTTVSARQIQPTRRVVRRIKSGGGSAISPPQCRRAGGDPAAADRILTTTSRGRL